MSSSRRVGKREVSKLVEAVEAGGESMLLPSDTDRDLLRCSARAVSANFSTGHGIV
jgi:hypothetical protein